MSEFTPSKPREKWLRKRTHVKIRVRLRFVVDVKVFDVTAKRRPASVSVLLAGDVLRALNELQYTKANAVFIILQAAFIYCLETQIVLIDNK